MPQGSVIGNHHKIELVTPDVCAHSPFVVVNLVLSDSYHVLRHAKGG
jgi:hypothetical protein